MPTYLLSVSILSPALMKLGVDMVAAHLFFIYWGVLGAVTPPTCEAAVVAAGHCQRRLAEDGFQCLRTRGHGLLPPLLHGAPSRPLCQGPTDVAFAAVTGFLGSISMAYGLFGWKDSPFNMPLRSPFFRRRRDDALPRVGYSGGAWVLPALVLNKVIKPNRWPCCRMRTPSIP